MGRIKILDEKTRLKIAAGEVVQNPASVVKELLENAIDASATKIVLNIMKGGKRLIEIIDDGVGMSSEDAKIAFQRYSTSKISDVSDLESIQSLGFRGEALASIAAVSQVELITKERDSKIGTKINVKASEMTKVEDAERGNGTTVRVQNLFFNVPARLKFLRTSQAEFQSILNFITNYSLLYNSIHFILNHDSNEILNSPAVSNRLDKIFFIYGKDIVKKMIRMDYKTDILKISGFISRPVIQRGTRKSYSIFVNQRYIKSKLIVDAIDEAYKKLIPKNRHPIVVLSLEIAPAMIDVNVHPTKQEIKFSQEKLVFDTLHKVIRDSFDREKLIPKLEIKRKAEVIQKDEAPILAKTTSIQQKLIRPLEQVTSDKATISELPAEGKLPPVEIIGQTHDLFIIAADNENLYIIDQHAAHERIMFEKFLKKLEKGSVQTQSLLKPIILEFPLQDSQILKSKLEIMKDFGFEIDLFGKNTYRITKLPIILGKTIKKDEIQLVCDELLERIDPKSKRIPSREELAQLYGCKAAVKSGDKLTPSQMLDIYQELRRTDNPYRCAHNRPTIITFSKSELERKFQR